ncbi:MAG: T9SS type A sorting domain-containing protein [Saprospiraceae bacterium]
MRYFSILVLFLTGTLVTNAQLYTVPLNENTVLKSNADLLQPVKIKKGGGIIDTLDLPFIDDFSYAGPYPDCDLWIDKSTYVNNTIAINPPTIGVATFDGVNQFGAPYGNSGQGSADTLTSMPLDLSGRNSGSNVQVSFFYEPRGYGDKPGVNDSLFLELKTINDDWVTVWAYADTTVSYETPAFNFVNIEITNNNYFYKGFQFRFRNYATLTGLRDLWHVDYVRVTEGQNVTPILNDVAFTKKPISIFKEYTSLPWRHFEGFVDDELATQNSITIHNHFNTTQFVGPANLLLSNDEGVGTDFGTNILNQGTPPINGNIPVGMHQIDSVINAIEYGLIRNYFANLNDLDGTSFTLEVNMTPSNQQATVAPVVRNDTVRRQFIFDDYFAYDDGNAETAVAGGRIGDQFAVRFHTNVDDTLKAIRINLPRLSGNITNQRINLKVWLNDLNSTPAYQRNFIGAVYVDSIDSWTTYSLDTSALFIPAGTTFYVGWQQATTPPSIGRSFLIGYDRNSVGGFKNIFQNIGNTWEKIDSANVQPAPGSIMIRPVLGMGEYHSTAVKKAETVINVKLYPNPATNWLNIELEKGNHQDYHYNIYNTIGMLMQSERLDNRINTANLPNGWYIVQLIHEETGQVITKKLMIAR